jgi:hypothetical protein
MSYRDDVQALAARKSALEHELSTLTKERDAAHRDLEDARAKARLPVLDNIRVGTPCRVSWDSMPGDERKRACSKCEKNVYNISELTRAEAEALIIRHEGKLCVRYYQRPDGTILLSDCTIRGAAYWKRRAGVAALAALVAVGAYIKLRRSDDGEAAAIRIQAAETTSVPVQLTSHEAQKPPMAHHDPIRRPHKEKPVEVMMGDYID